MALTHGLTGSIELRRNSERANDRVFRRHHMGRLLRRIGVLLPHWLAGPELARAARGLEQVCWRELGNVHQPVFDGDLPSFLMTDGDSQQLNLSAPASPMILAARMAVVEPPPPPLESRIGTNLDRLARVLNLTSFERQWLLWSYCVCRFGRAILPVIPVRDETLGCDMLAQVCEMPVNTVRDDVASRRLYTWGFLDGSSADGEMPSVLSGWLSVTDQFADWIGHSYATDTDLRIALCQAQVSLMPSR